MPILICIYIYIISRIIRKVNQFKPIIMLEPQINFLKFGILLLFVHFFNIHRAGLDPKRERIRTVLYTACDIQAHAREAEA